MVANPLVGSITVLALLMLFWPLFSKIIAKLRPPKASSFAAEQPVD
jgi:putative tricarboxylic transport membrane protein